MIESHTHSPFSKVSVIGLGYIGLPTAAMLASRKLEVSGVDVQAKVVETINRGEVHIIEPDLDIVVRTVVSDGYLKACIKPEPSDAFIIAVPTPFKDNFEPDLAYIESAVKSIAPILAKGNLVILESTSPVGTTEQVVTWLGELRPDLKVPCKENAISDINVAYCPERVLPGHVMRELVQNDRVIGGVTDKCARRTIELYRHFVEGDCIVTDARTAEMCKLTENSYRDVNIAFANELSIICDKLDINVWELIHLANRHPRVNILRPGPGVGGHCIAVDPWFIVSKTPEEAKLIHSARQVNDNKPKWVVEKVKDSIKLILDKKALRHPKDVSIVCYGLTFKADIDDMRESPALDIVEQISEFHQGPLMVVEPNISHLPSRIVQSAQLMDDGDYALKEADIVVLLVNHQGFSTVFQKESTQDCCVLDFTGICDSIGA